MAKGEVSQALITRMNEMHRKNEEVYKREQIEGRILHLSSMYHYGYAGGTAITESPYMIHVNKVIPRVNNAMAALYAKRPEIIVKPRLTMYGRNASLGEVALNYFTRVMKLSAELREWLFWARLGMYGCVKLGMERWRGLLLPSFRAQDPRAVRVDPTPDKFRPEEGKWQAFRYRRSLAQLRDGGMYEEKALDRLAETMSLRMGDKFREDTSEVWIWENYLRETVEGKERILLATVAHAFENPETTSPTQGTGGVSTPVSLMEDERVWIREDQFTDVAGLPGRFLFFRPSPKTWYPFSPVEGWLDMQKYINGLRSQKLLHAERANAATLVDVNKFTPQELAKLESAEPLKYVLVNGPVEGAMASEPKGNINPSIFDEENECDNTITEIDGFGSAQMGNTPTGPKTGSPSATRDAIIENSLRMRMSDAQEIWEEALESCYQGLLALAQNHMDGSLQFKVMGGFDMQVSKEEIQGEMEVIMGFGSTLPTDRQQEWSEAKEVFGMFNNDPLVDQTKLRRFTLSRLRGIKDAESWLNPPPPPPPPQPPMGPPGAPPGAPPGPPPGPMAPGAPPPPDPRAAMIHMILAAAQARQGATPLQSAGIMRHAAQVPG